MVPPVKKIGMLPVSQIKWTNAKSDALKSETDPLTDSEVDGFLTKLLNIGQMCPIMAVRDPFNEIFVDRTVAIDSSVENSSDAHKLFLVNILGHFRSEYLKCTLSALQKIASKIKIAYTDDDIDFIEKSTIEQASSSLWYRFRAGRITASNFKSVCRTSVEHPSVSLIKRICFPENYVFSSSSVQYGRENEKKARNTYFKKNSKLHSNLKIVDCGLKVNREFPHIGASPDGIVTCDCCGTGVVEVKCPFSQRNSRTLKAIFSKKNSPLIMVNGSLIMNKKHQYYYQIQMQMFVSDVAYCDFVVWNNSETLIVRCLKDTIFWEQEYPKTTSFFYKTILPELLGSIYSRSDDE